MLNGGISSRQIARLERVELARAWQNLDLHTNGQSEARNMRYEL